MLEEPKHKIHSTSKLAKSHGKDLVETGEMHLEKSHKDWYRRDIMGKQGGKPKYAPPKEMKQVKEWKKK